MISDVVCMRLMCGFGCFLFRRETQNLAQQAPPTPSRVCSSARLHCIITNMESMQSWSPPCLKYNLYGYVSLAKAIKEFAWDGRDFLDLCSHSLSADCFGYQGHQILLNMLYEQKHGTWPCSSWRLSRAYEHDGFRTSPWFTTAHQRRQQSVSIICSVQT